MKEILDKQVKKREFEKSSGVHVNSHKLTKKCVMKEINYAYVKMFLIEGSGL